MFISFLRNDYFTIDIVFECYVESFFPLHAYDDVADVQFINPKHVNIDDIGLKSIKNVIKTIRNKV
jgi:hypothetical protein